MTHSFELVWHKRTYTPPRVVQNADGSTTTYSGTDCEAMYAEPVAPATEDAQPTRWSRAVAEFKRVMNLRRISAALLALLISALPYGGEARGLEGAPYGAKMARQ